jgi:hypothetical protein
MAQLTIYLPDDIENKAREIAQAKGKSVSRWVADQVVRSLEDTWSKGVLDAAGALPDFPSVEEIRKGYGQDVSRESLE